MMKKIVLVLLITLLAFTISACRGEDEVDYTPPEAKDQEIEEEDTEIDDVNDEEEDEGEEADREDSEDEDADREELDSATHTDPNLLTPEEIEAMFGGGVGIWDDEAFDLIDGMEEELWDLIDQLEEELDRLMDATEDEYRMDSLSDQLEYFTNRMHEQWDNFYEQFEMGLISSPDFIQGLEGVLQQVRTFTFR